MRRSALPLLVTGWALSLPLIGCTGGTGSATPRQALASQEEVRRSLSVLAADSMEGRGTGTEGAARAARYIAAELESYGVEAPYPPDGDRDSAYFQRVPLLRPPGGPGIQLAPGWDAFDSAAVASRVADVNVIGIVRGADPERREEAVVIGAHYDHIGIGPAVGGDSIYNGADDDASGVVTVLEIARSVASGPPPDRTVIFLLTTGEEHGLLGTRWYLDRPVVPLERTAADLQVEMVGRPDTAAGGAGRAWLTGYGRSTLGPSLAAAGIPVLDDPRPAQRFFERSDNIAFACEGIPAHTLSSFGLHDDYHGPDDEIERIDFDHFTAVIQAAVRAAHVLANGERPAWNPSGSPAADPAICG